MVPVIRFATVALLIGAGLLLPVFLRGQAPVSGQPWGPGTSPIPTDGTPRVIASTDRPQVDTRPQTTPPAVPVPDDGLRQLGPRQLPPVVEMAPPLRPTSVSEPSTTKRVVHLKPVEPLAAASAGTTEATVPQARGNLKTVFMSNLSVELQGLPEVVVDDLMPVELIVRNQGAQVLTGVRIELPLPGGIRYVAGHPEPEVQPDRLVWELGVLEVRGERRLRTDLMVKTVEDIALRALATYNTGAPYRPQVIRPTFAVTQISPDVVPRGMATTLQIQVTNHGQKPLARIVLTDRLPFGLFHPQGQEVTAEIGALNPGESRVIKLELQARQSGRWVNEVVAQAEGGVKTISRSAIVVAEPSLTVRVRGPERVPVAGEADYRLEVLNGRQGPAAHNLHLTQTLPEGLELVQATTNGLFDPINRRITWQLGSLEPGQMQTVFVKARCLASGTWTTRATLSADRLAPTTADHVVTGEGGCQLGLVVQGREERLEVNGETVYEARLTNSGSRPARDIRLSAWVPEGIAPQRAEGPDGLGVRIQQQQVLFEPLPLLDPQASVVYRLRVKGQRAGIWRLRVEAQADQMAKPLVDELPVNVQPDSRTQLLPGRFSNR